MTDLYTDLEIFCFKKIEIFQDFKIFIRFRDFSRFQGFFKILKIFCFSTSYHMSSRVTAKTRNYDKYTEFVEIKI